MMPLLPPSHLEALAREHLDSQARLYRSRHIEDPDSFLGDRASSPASFFTALRRLVTTGPIGAVRSWVDARHDRRRGHPSAEPIPPVDTGWLPGAPVASIPGAEAERLIEA